MISVVWATPEGVEAPNLDEALQAVQHQAAQRQAPRYQQDRQIEPARQRHDCIPDIRTALDGVRAMQQQAQPQPVLMSVDNPAGWKLEELLECIRVEVMAKNAKLAASAGHGVDPAELRRTMVRTTVRELNERIVALVMQAIYIQQEVLAELKKLGPDQGPLGKPRI